MKVFDLHCDTLSALMLDRENNIQSNLLRNNHHVDLEKMKKGDYLLQCFAVFIDTEYAENPLFDGMKLIDLYYTELDKYKNLIAPVYKYEDIEYNMGAGKMSAILTAEEGEICLGSTAVLRNLYRLGVRMMTLTWNHENQLAYPNYTMCDTIGKSIINTETSKGLKEKGYAFLEEMERLHMIIDVSHLSDAGFFDVYNNTKKPFIASHSNSRAICPHARNLTDDMIRAMADRGCIIGINYYGTFLDGAGYEIKGYESRIEDMVRHIKYIRALGGIDILALGSDFDGITGTLEISDASHMPKLYEALIKAGFHESEVDKIFYKNALRVFKELL